MNGLVWALLGAALALVGGGLGSGIGLSYASRAAAGVVSEDPDKSGKLLIFQLFPSSNVLYGFVVAILVFMRTIMDADIMAAGISIQQGLQYLFVCLPITIVGFLTAITQSKVCVACINMVGKNSELSGKGLIMAALIELVTLLALVISMIGIFMI